MHLSHNRKLDQEPWPPIWSNKSSSHTKWNRMKHTQTKQTNICTVYTTLLRPSNIFNPRVSMSDTLWDVILIEVWSYGPSVSNSFSQAWTPEVKIMLRIEQLHYLEINFGNDIWHVWCDEHNESFRISMDWNPCSQMISWFHSTTLSLWFKHRPKAMECLGIFNNLR